MKQSDLALVGCSQIENESAKPGWKKKSKILTEFWIASSSHPCSGPRMGLGWTSEPIKGPKGMCTQYRVHIPVIQNHRPERVRGLQPIQLYLAKHV